MPIAPRPGPRSRPAASTPLVGVATRVHVSYRLTALHEPAEDEIARFAAGYEGYLASWKRAIDAVL
jgi:hypothetical protein